MTPTPRTEAQRFDPVNHCEQRGSSYGQMKRSADGDYVPVELARELECENARLKEVLGEYLSFGSLDGRAERQPLRDKLKALLSPANPDSL
jgi:hypothetical protein